ncbi:MAG: hypothetical protein ACRDSG_13960 [Pseudonocardiaceae bacterium]
MTNTTTDLAATRSPAVPSLTPGEALAELFLTNADKGCNADNDTLVVELLKRMRAIQAVTANPACPGATSGSPAGLIPPTIPAGARVEALFPDFDSP